MNALSSALQGYQQGYGMAREQKARKRQEGLQNQLAGILNGGTGQTPPSVGTPPIMPNQGGGNAPAPDPQANPLEQINGMRDKYTQAANLYAKNGDAKTANQFLTMANSMQTQSDARGKQAAATNKTQTAAQNQEYSTLYRMGQGVMNGDFTLDQAKEHLIQNGADPQELAQLTDQSLPGYMKMLEARLGGQTQVLKDKETVYDPLTGRAVYTNRGPQTVSDGAALVGNDGSELYNNEKDVTPTADIQNYEAAKAQGYKGSMFEYQAAIKQAGRSTTSVSMGKGENAFDTETGKMYAKRNQSIISSANGARSKINRLKTMQVALADPNVYTGSGGESIQKLKRLGVALGVEGIEDDVANADVINALGNQLALSMRSTSDGEGMPGQLSDRDIQFLTSSVPNLGKTREGNVKLIDYALKIENRKVDVETWRQEYMQMNGNRLDSGFEQYLAQKVAMPENQLFDEPTASAATDGAHTGSGTQDDPIVWGG